MVTFLKKRLQVFVSSTYTDLLEERQAAVEAILTSGHFPAGMELFTAGDESQWESIKQWIDESDIYLLILGARYGSIESKTGKSYTQLEYEYAIQKEKPFFACVLTEAAIDRKVNLQGKSILELHEPSKHAAFKEMALSRLVKMCDDKKDIKIAVGETLAHLARSESLIGWVKADSQMDPSALAQEIARLSKENSMLRAQLTTHKAEATINGLTFSELTDLLVSSKSLNSLYAMGDELLSYAPDPFGNDEGISGPDELMEAVKLGLLSTKTNLFGKPKYKVTEPGRMYLSKLRLAALRQAKTLDAPQAKLPAVPSEG